MVEETVKTKDDLMAGMQVAVSASDWKAVSKISAEIAKMVATEEKAEKDVKLAVLAEATISVKNIFDIIITAIADAKPMSDKLAGNLTNAINKLASDKALDVADGVWFARDFGEGELTSCKLMKAAAKAKSTGATNGSYVSRPEKSADLLAQVGEHVMFAEATEVTIDKVNHTMPAGTTLNEAYKYSTNGGWRNRIRMALLKEAGLA